MATLKARTSDSRLYRFWDRFLTDDEYPHLFVVDLETKAVLDLLPGSKRYFGLQAGAPDYDVSPDGQTVVFAANDTDSPHLTLDADLFAVSTSGGPVRNLTADNPAEDRGPVWSPDGRFVAYGREQKADGWPDYARLALLELATSKTTILTEGWDNSAGVYDLLGQWASDATWGRHHSYGGYPFSNLANTERWSPNRYASAFNTPMLVLHGERDYRVPVTQGLELYGVLKAKGVPARLVYYPDENHWILKPQNSRHWYGEVLAWLGKCLGTTTAS